MSLSPYLFFNDQCEAAFQRYAQVFGGQIVAMMTHAESPMAEQTPPERQNTIIHARMNIGGTFLMGGDAPPEHFAQMQGFSVAYAVTDPAEAERIFHALAENGVVRMPIAETFWAVRFGMLVDQFGTPWMISCESAA